jgi:hypothetical protein
MTEALQNKLNTGAELVDALHAAGVSRAERFKLYCEAPRIDDVEALDNTLRSITRGAHRVVRTCLGLAVV